MRSTRTTRSDYSQTTNTILDHIVLHWDAVSSDTTIMGCLDMQTNSMARYLKQHHPNTSDHTIQANVLAMMLTFHHIIDNLIMFGLTAPRGRPMLYGWEPVRIEWTGQYNDNILDKILDKTHAETLDTYEPMRSTV